MVGSPVSALGASGFGRCVCLIECVCGVGRLYINHSVFLFVRLVICCGWKWVWGENGRKRAVGGSVRASGGRACLSVRRRGERGGRCVNVGVKT